MDITREQLLKIMPYAKTRVESFLPFINKAMAEFNINTKARQASFLAQLAHESGELRYTSEIASGASYEGRTDLGNTQPGDGIKYKGHGLIQITGRANHLACGLYFAQDFISNPLLLTEPEYAARSAGWFWDKYKNLNLVADSGDQKLITKRINGGYNGLDDRLKYFNIAIQVV